MILMALLALAAADAAQSSPQDKPVVMAPAAPAAPSIPPPPPAVKLSRKPSPAGSPQTWVTDEDYPAQALRENLSGTLGLRLDIDENGVPFACVILSSSGSELLDNRACNLLSERARFNPALDRKKRPVRASWTSRFTWRIPTAPPVPITSWAIVVRMTVSEGGTVLSCEQQDFGSPESFKGLKPCLQMPGALAEIVQQKTRGAAKGPVHLVAFNEQQVEGKPFPAGYVRPAGLRPYMAVGVAFDIDANGTPKQCRLTELLGSSEVPTAVCGPTPRYEPFADHGGKPYKAQHHYFVLSDGAAPPPQPVKLDPLTGAPLPKQQ